MITEKNLRLDSEVQYETEGKKMIGYVFSDCSGDAESGTGIDYVFAPDVADTENSTFIVEDQQIFINLLNDLNCQILS